MPSSAEHNQTDIDSWLITGGAGFIGSNFVHYWKEKYPRHQLVVLDALTYAGNPQNLRNLNGERHFRFVQGDIGDRALVEALLREHTIRGIVNFAAESHVDRSIIGPEAFVTTNIQGTHNLLLAAKSVWLGENPAPHRFHQVSTDEVYGSLGNEDPPFREDHPYQPNSPYAASKAAADHLVRAYHHTYGLDITISNCSNNYGPYQFPEKLVALTICNILLGKNLPVYGNGENVRDWLYVTDHCRALEYILRGGRAGDTYNVGGGTEMTNIDLVRTLCDTVDGFLQSDETLARRFPDAPGSRGRSSRELITFVKDRPGHDWRYAIDSGNLQRHLGYRADTDIKSGLSGTVRWYLNHQTWWEAVMDGSYQGWIDRQYG